MNQKLPTIIAIDGPSGAGKSTIASTLAERLGIPYLDTGAMYRAVALIALRAGLEPPLDEDDASQVEAVVAEDRVSVLLSDGRSRVVVDGEDVSSFIRTPECSAMSSAVSALTPVRRAMVALQRRIGRQNGGVMEGRDIGTVVFPDARLKVFLTASGKERARRRHEDMKRQDINITVDEVRRQQEARDQQDSSRADSPLAVAAGAVVVDSTGMTPDEVVERLLDELERSRQEKLDGGREDTVRSRNHRG